MKLLTAVFFLIASIQHASCLHSEESCMGLSNQLFLQLKALRTAFAEIKDYFQAKDDELDILLLNEDLLEDFKGYLGCQSVSDTIRFYLEEVLPKAINSSKKVKGSVGTIGNMLAQLKITLKRCHRFLICEKRNQSLKQIKETYNTLQEKGIYKAMGEFDIFLNYIEEYLVKTTKK